MDLKVLKLSVAVCAFLYSQEALSQSVSDSIKVIDEVVITGAKTHRHIGNVTQKVDVIKSGEIDAVVLGNLNISEAIARKPGASVSALSRNDAGGLMQG